MMVKPSDTEAFLEFACARIMLVTSAPELMATMIVFARQLAQNEAEAQFVEATDAFCTDYLKQHSVGLH
jgi:hypothetical protein